MHEGYRFVGSSSADVETQLPNGVGSLLDTQKKKRESVRCAFSSLKQISLFPPKLFTLYSFGYARMALRFAL